MEPEARGREQEAWSMEHGAWGMGKEKENAGQKPFRRTITRGSMRDFYNHSHGRTHQNNSIRLIIIILIPVLVTYLYLRF
jgi:hypothetical protein